MRFLKDDVLKLEMTDSEKDRFIAVFDDRVAFVGQLASSFASDGCNLLIIRNAVGPTSTRISERYVTPSAAALEIMHRNAESTPGGCIRYHPSGDRLSDGRK